MSYTSSWVPEALQGLHVVVLQPVGLQKVLFILRAPSLPFALLTRRRTVQLGARKGTRGDFIHLLHQTSARDQ